MEQTDLHLLPNYTFILLFVAIYKNNQSNYLLYKSTFKLTYAISNLNQMTVSIIFQQRSTITTERHFKSEYLFRMWSVVTDPVTSLEFQTKHCATNEHGTVTLAPISFPQ